VIAGIISRKAHFGGLFCLTFFRVSPAYNSFRPVALETSLETSSLRRAGWFTALLVLVNLVSDGWSGRPGPLSHQLWLLPVTAAFLYCLYRFLNVSSPGVETPYWTPQRALGLAVLFQAAFLGLYLYECHHFAFLGYQCRRGLAYAVFLPAFVLLVLAGRRPLRAQVVFVATIASYLAGMIVAIAGFPLTYLRSDMLAVIFWANNNLLHHVDPYTTVYVANRVYDFPYLPGMFLAYTPFAAMHADLRLGCVFYVLGCAALVYFAARKAYRLEVAALLATLLLCPFLQYRHELYTQPHWFTLLAALVLMQRRRFAWAAVAFGVSMAIYQLSWVIFPFFALYAFRRRGPVEVAKLIALAAAAALVVDGPFLASAFHRVASNTVGQWSLMPRADADPINLAYWATYVVAPAHLQRLQAVLMIGIFGWCLVKKRCATTADTARWMVAALAVFLLFNVIIDGYFYLTLLVLALGYTCIANKWWNDPALIDAPRNVALEG